MDKLSIDLVYSTDNRLEYKSNRVSVEDTVNFLYMLGDIILETATNRHIFTYKSRTKITKGRIKFI